MPQINPLLRMIEANAVPLGMQCFTADHALIEVLGLTGFDFVMLDTEHSPANRRRFCEDTASALHTAVNGTHLTRSTPPPSGFPGR
jgi:2-keto-3-deoxy-L-rhamnonate aldolase RhmA